jgi:hypothetical protein
LPLASIAASWACRDPANQPIIDHIWREMDFAWWTIDANNGFNDPCNPTFPVGRAITASMLMGYSGNGNPTCDTKDRNILNWALCWAGSRYDELTTSCVTASDAFATTYSLPLGSHTSLWPAGIYAQTIEGLSGTIMHEARHWDCGHNGGDGATDCVRGRSCDDSWGDGCPWPKNGAGANRYNIVWLGWYANQGTRGSITLKEGAVVRANEIVSDGFTHVPCFRLGNNGTPMDIKTPGCR